MSAKPYFAVNLNAGAASALDAHAVLALTTGAIQPAAMKQRRAPLGVYNVSTSRVCGKVARLCERLEMLLKVPDPFSQNPDLWVAMESVIDYMELAIYSAAEHVDDVYAIAEAYLPNENLRGRNPQFRTFDKAIKSQKRFVSSLANFIKHEHSRLRLCAVEFWHDGRPVTFHGYFIEGVLDGALGPSGRFHSEQELFSVTGFVWEILGFLLGVSRAVGDFVSHVVPVQVGPHGCTSDVFSSAVAAAARLPLYTFGEPHLFDRVSVQIGWEGDPIAPLDSGLYGGLLDPWSRTDAHDVGQMVANYAGDGSSREFRMPEPKQISIKHWGPVASHVDQRANAPGS